MSDKISFLHSWDRGMPNSISSSTLFFPRMYFSSFSISMDLFWASRRRSVSVRESLGVERTGRERRGKDRTLDSPCRDISLSSSPIF